MTVTYVPIVGANMVNSIVNAASAAVAKTNTSAGNGRNSRTKLVLRLDDVDATTTANDRTVTMVLKAPPALQIAALGAANEPTYLPWIAVTPANAATQAATATVQPFLAVSAVDVTARTITVVFTVITGADNLSYYLNVDFCHSIV